MGAVDDAGVGGGLGQLDGGDVKALVWGGYGGWVGGCVVRGKEGEKDGRAYMYMWTHLDIDINLVVSRRLYKHQHKHTHDRPSCM